MHQRGGLLLLLLLVLSSTPARAQDASGPTFALRVFRPAIDSKGLVTVNGSQTLGHLDFSLGLVADYAHRSLSLHAHGVDLRVDHLVSMQLQAALGLFGGPRWQGRTRGVSLELGVSLPVHVMLGRRSPAYTDVDPNFNRALTFSGQSVGDLGVHAKLRLLDTSHHPVGLALLLTVQAPTGRSEQFLGEGQATFRPEVIVDRELGRARRGRVVLNAGAIVRPARHRFVDEGTPLSWPAPTAGQPACAPARGDGTGCGTGLARTLGTQLTWSLGAAYAVVPQRLELIAEVFGAHDVTGALGGHPVEALAAARVYLARSSFFTVGAGAGVLPPRIVDGQGGMTGLPVARVFVGFTFEPVIGDRDHDGFKDDVDRCPDEAETRNGYLDHDGCPDERPAPPPPPPVPVPAPPPEPTRVVRKHGALVTFEKIYFRTASAEILPRSYPLLDEIVALLQASPDILLVEVAGHADERGDDGYNLLLTEARAQSVRAYLVEHGVEGSRLSAHGYGEAEPAVDEATQQPCREHGERCWEKNRRVEFRILSQ